MTDSSEQTPAQELAEVIAELEQYRERLLNDTVEAAQKAKLMKSAVMAKLDPELAKIDATLQHLREQQAMLQPHN
jgi:membrane protein insertase Oxa1/YidC/SpoIIIJ